MRRLEADLQAHASSRIFVALPGEENTDECSRQGQSYAEQEVAVIAPSGDERAAQHGTEKKSRLRGKENQVCIQGTEAGRRNLKHQAMEGRLSHSHAHPKDYRHQGYRPRSRQVVQCQMPDGDDNKRGDHYPGFIEDIEKPPSQKAKRNHQSRLYSEERSHINDSLFIREALDQKEHTAPVDYINRVQQKHQCNRQLLYIGTNVRPDGKMSFFHHA